MTTSKPLERAATAFGEVALVQAATTKVQTDAQLIECFRAALEAMLDADEIVAVTQSHYLVAGYCGCGWESAHPRHRTVERHKDGQRHVAQMIIHHLLGGEPC